MDSSLSDDRRQGVLTRTSNTAISTEPTQGQPGSLSQKDRDRFIIPRHVQWIGGEERLIRTSEEEKRDGLGKRVEIVAGPSIETIYYYNQDTESESNISGSEDNEYEFSRLPPLSTASSRPIAYDGSNGFLQRQLSNAIEDTSPPMKVSQRTGFVPRMQLDSIMDEDAVMDELLKIRRSFKRRLQFWKSTPKVQIIKEQAQIICGSLAPSSNVNGDQNPKPKSYRKVFATLLLIERPGTIERFIEEVCDADLPLIPQKNALSPFSLCRKDDPGGKLKCFERWRRPTLEQFEQQQWKMLAPNFTRSEKGKVKHQSLSNNAILPFTFRERTRSGAHGEVFKVQIHPEHHNFTSHQEIDVFFAVKTIRGEEKDFRQEVRMLKRLSHSHHHLISLLATYQHGGHFHLIFPWAECDLLAYWTEKNPEPAHNCATLKWMARQCEGIAEGLAHVHHHETSSGSSLFDSLTRTKTTIPQSLGAGRGSPQIRRTRLVFGKHGDLKPTNLLWFPNSRDSSDIGTIKISDFGTGEFSTTDAPSASESVSYSPQYRPPECDLLDSEIGSSYDIWTLGCLYLEFITWYIGGRVLLEELDTIRRKTTGRIRHANAYFELVGGQEGDSEAAVARVKPAIQDFIDLRLRRDPECSTFLAEFLDLIQTHMLIVEPRPGEVGRRRISCGHVFRHLGEMIHKFKEVSQSVE